MSLALAAKPASSAAARAAEPCGSIWVSMEAEFVTVQAEPSDLVAARGAGRGEKELSGLGWLAGGQFG